MDMMVKNYILKNQISREARSMYDEILAGLNDSIATKVVENFPVKTFEEELELREELLNMSDESFLNFDLSNLPYDLPAFNDKKRGNSLNERNNRESSTSNNE